MSLTTSASNQRQAEGSRSRRAVFPGPPHTLLAVTTAQHLMGVATAVPVHGLLRYPGR